MEMVLLLGLSFAACAFAGDAPISEQHHPKGGWEKFDRASAKVGDFSEYDLAIAVGGKMRQEIVSVGDHKIVAEETITANGTTKKSKTAFIYDGPDIEG